MEKIQNDLVLSNLAVTHATGAKQLITNTTEKKTETLVSKPILLIFSED